MSAPVSVNGGSDSDDLVIVYSIGVSIAISVVMVLIFHYFSGDDGRNQSALVSLVTSLFTGTKLPTAGAATAESAGKETINATDNSILGTKALALHNAGKYDEALKVYREVRIQEPKNAHVLYRYALLLSSYYKDVKQSEEIINEVLAVDPKHADVLGLYAVLLENKGDFASAKEMYSRAYLADPLNVPRLRNFASLLDHLSQHTEARCLYEEALALSPHNIDILYDFAYNLECSQLFEKAEEVYKRILKFNPNHSDAGNNYAGLLYMKCKRTKNMEDLEEAIRLLENSKKKCKVASLNLSGCKMLQLQLCCCAKCGKACTEYCGNCKLVRYCCKACQTADWKAHKKLCQSKSSPMKNSNGPVEGNRVPTDTAADGNAAGDAIASHNDFFGCTDCSRAHTRSSKKAKDTSNGDTDTDHTTNDQHPSVHQTSSLPE